MKNAALAGWLGAGVLIAGASADIVHFVNPAPGQPGHWDWHWSNQAGEQRWLNITLSPYDQPGGLFGSSVRQLGVNFIPEGRNFTIGGAAVASDGVWTLPLEAGTPLGSQHYAVHSFHWMEGVGEDESMFPPSQRKYMGVLTTNGQYGWIEVERRDASFTAYSWAYETQPGVPIVAGAIPAPGAAVLLALASITVSRRRRT